MGVDDEELEMIVDTGQPAAPVDSGFRRNDVAFAGNDVGFAGNDVASRFRRDSGRGRSVWELMAEDVKR